MTANPAQSVSRPPALPLAFSTLACPGATLAAAAELGAATGYQGIELRLIDGELIDPAMPPDARAQVKSITDAAGLPIVAVDSSIRLTADGAAAQLAAFLELAADWDAPLVRVFGGPLPAATADPAARREALDRAARVLDAAAPAARRLGVAIGVETHDDFSASATVAELLALVAPGVIGAVWDSHHPHKAGETPAQVRANLGDRILLAQVKDARRAPERDDGWQLVLLGEGEVAVREMLAELAAARYPGWVSVEWEKRWHPEIEPPEVALPQHHRLLTQWIAELQEAQ
ncbi:MAG TPA: sugar phosphate isomerase/epimerase family protein [Streptosporangiaceae bacterium]|jgi:sugar phosphate isomerase/epimerase